MKTNLIALMTLMAFAFTGYAQNVGIGTLTPAHKLDVTGNIRATGSMFCGTDFELNGGVGIGNVILNDKPIILRSGADLTHKIVYKASINGIEVTGNNAVQLRTLSGDVLTVVADKVGIGNTSPSYTLDVNGNGHFNAGLRIDGVYGTDVCPGGCTFSTYQFNDAGFPNQTGFRNMSLWVQDDMRANRYHTASDARIKNVVGISNSSADLEMLMGIQITDYRYVDRTMGTEEVKKVIAQQVERVYPEAVGKDVAVVPDIYQMSSIQDNFIPLMSDVQEGDKVRLIFEDDSKVLANVLEVTEDGFFVDQNRSGLVFVYGREVEDFRVVDYEAISMLNVSATQEQQQLIESLQQRIEELEKENSELKADHNNRLEAIEAKLGMGMEVMND